MPKAIGIYFGNEYCCVAFIDATVRVITTGPNNEFFCRSCVAMKKGIAVVGNAAYNNWKRYSPNIVTNLHELLATSTTITWDGKEYEPEQIIAELFRQLKADASVKLNEEVTYAVITVPAYFNEKQKTVTRKAAELAGLNVQRLLAEPIAAAISFRADKMAAEEDKIFLVYDFGKVSLDISILVASGGTFIESGSSRDPRLGGDDVDRLLSEYVVEEAQKATGLDIHKLIENLPPKRKNLFQGEFKIQVENAKKVLNQDDNVMVLVTDILEDEDGEPVDIEVTITREKFQSMIRPLVQRTIDLIDELLQKTGCSIEYIDNILLVGGTSSIPLVKKMLSNIFGTEKILLSDNPMCAIAEGAAVLSARKLLHYNELSFVIDTEFSGTYRTKHSVILNIVGKNGHVFREDIIVNSGELLPVEKIYQFRNTMRRGNIVRLRLFSDSENGCMDVLGDVYLLTKNKGFTNNQQVNIRFSLSWDGTINVSASFVDKEDKIRVFITGGALDAHCFQNLQRFYDEVSNRNDDVGRMIKSKLRQLVSDIIDQRLYPSPKSKIWKEWEDKINCLKSLVIS